MFLPTSIKEVRALGWEYIDVILFTGDAYIDHPAFGAAVIGRSLEAAGYRVAIVPQPNWRDDLRDFKKLGAPRLFFGVTAGAMDSTVMHYTPTRRLRSNDAYTPGGKHGARPDYPTIVYTQILRELYPDSLILLGGIEASMRRFTHYDYLQERLRPSFLVESGADLILYGMGEVGIVDFARKVESGREWCNLNQIVYLSEEKSTDNAIILNSYEECLKNKEKFAENFLEIEKQSNRMEAERLVEPTKGKYVVVNPPYPTFTTKECDATYALPYERQPAPRYRGKVIPAWDMIKNSVMLHRGCYGGCSFCAISMHQGKYIASRSEESVLAEIKQITQSAEFRGTISDVGGPSANMWKSSGIDQTKCKKCSRPSCLYPKPCANLKTYHQDILKLYAKIEKIEGVKHIYVGSGIRYDMPQVWDGYMQRVIEKHTSGRLKVAPEHTEEHILKLMRKPKWEEFLATKTRFDRVCRDKGLPYIIIPYFISSHPGCTKEDMQLLATKTKGVRTEDVQDFTPTPLTMSTTMYYCGCNPSTQEKLFVAKEKSQKEVQKSYFFDKNQSKKGNFVHNKNDYNKQWQKKKATQNVKK
ncbi:MAG: YgiQ family radical SAM protein [Rikenellaceae bacterium]